MSNDFNKYTKEELIKMLTAVYTEDKRQSIIKSGMIRENKELKVELENAENTDLEASSKILIVRTNNLINDIVTLSDLILDTPLNTLQQDVQEIEYKLNGTSNGIVLENITDSLNTKIGGTSNIVSDLDTVNTSISGTTTSSLTANVSTLDTKIGGTANNTIAKVNALSNIISGTSAISLTVDIDTIKTSISGSNSGTLVVNSRELKNKITSDNINALEGINSQNMKLSGSNVGPLKTIVTNLNTKIGVTGSVSTITKLDDINTAISGTTTDSLDTNLTTLNNKIGKSGNTFSRIDTLNTGISGSTTDSLETNITSVNTKIGVTGSVSTITKLDDINTAISGTTTDSLTTNIDNLKIKIGGGGDIFPRIESLNTKIQNVVSMKGITTLTVETKASISGNEIKFNCNDGSATQEYSYTYSVSDPVNDDAKIIFVNQMKEITFINDSGSTINSINNLLSYLNVFIYVGAIFKSSTTDAIDNTFDLLTSFRGNNTLNSIIGQPMLNSAKSNIFDVIGTLDINISSSLKKISESLVSNIGVESIFNDIGRNNRIINGTSTGSSLESRLTTQLSAIDDTVYSLPNNIIFDVVSIGIDNGDNIQIIFNGINDPYISIVNNVQPDNDFVFIDGNGGEIRINNRSGGSLGNKLQIVKYLKSVFPPGSKLNRTISDTVSSNKTIIGATGNSIRSKLGAIDRLLVNSPTGSIDRDLSTARNRLVMSQGFNLESDIENVGNNISAAFSGSGILENYIGKTVITNSGGGPVTGTSIATSIRNNSSNVGVDPNFGNNSLDFLNNFTLAVASFSNANDLQSQISAFIEIFNTKRDDNVTTNFNTIRLNVPSGGFTSLDEIIRNINFLGNST